MNKKTLTYAYIILGAILFVNINTKYPQNLDDLSFITNSFTKEAFAEDFGYASCYNADFGETLPSDLCPVTPFEKSICMIEDTSQEILITAGTLPEYNNQAIKGDIFEVLTISDFESGSLGALTNSGDLDWEVFSGANVKDGTYSARSNPMLGDKQESILRYEFVVNPGEGINISFDWDVLKSGIFPQGAFSELRINGSTMFNLDGALRPDGYNNYDIDILEPGSYYIEWVYKKYVVPGGVENGARIDNIIATKYFVTQESSVSLYPKELIIGDITSLDIPVGIPSNNISLNTLLPINTLKNTSFTWRPIFSTASVNQSQNILVSIGVKFFSDLFPENEQTSKYGNLNILLENKNEDPYLDNISPVMGEYLIEENDTIDLPVSINIVDADEDFLDVTLEISKDDFNTIEQSFNYNNITPSEPIQHIFTNLGEGEYKWRVTAQESQIKTYCQGYENQLSPSPITIQTQSNKITIAQTPTPDIATTPDITTTPLAITPVTITGTIYSDENKNGQQDPDEKGLPNITVFISYENKITLNHNVFEKITHFIIPTVRASEVQKLETVTDKDGRFEFYNIPPGEVTITIDQNDPDIPKVSSLTEGFFERKLVVLQGNVEAKTGLALFENNIPKIKDTPPNNINNLENKNNSNETIYKEEKKLEETGIKPLYLSIIAILMLIISLINPKRIMSFIKSKIQ